ncbi:type I secretion system permease/ATPase [Xanthobacter autotrophicus]|uniref:type I secretion system permease/ATPase n=1 Tax=Xanthobacter autotrophicus TaxID=280 RepID=UPI00372C0DC5
MRSRPGKQHSQPPQRPTLAGVLGSYRMALVGVGAMSAVVNLLYLNGSLFMLEVYDRVLQSQSLPTLAGLAALSLALYLFQYTLELLRARILARMGAGLDARLDRPVLAAMMDATLASNRGAAGLQPLKDLDQVRSFIGGLGPSVLMDLVWLPLYLVVCFSFHPAIGIAALIGTVVIVGLAVLSDTVARHGTLEAARLGAVRWTRAEALRRHAETSRALGMGGPLADEWAMLNARLRAVQGQFTDTGNTLGLLSRVARAILQSAVLAVGAVLVIEQQATAGIMIASSILVARALMPVEQAVGYSRAFVAARQSWRRLEGFLAASPPAVDPLELPLPSATLEVRALALVPPGGNRRVLREVSFSLKAGQGLAIVGPSASGKSSLARALAGVWPAQAGEIRLDGARPDRWNAERLGRHTGYVPQVVELLEGTIGQNIARFSPDATPEAILKAARTAGIHDLVLRLADGYETAMGEAGQHFSAGQRQRVALARALYGDPFLVVLDEPNANLDTAGERSLSEAIRAVRARGGIVIVVTHREAVHDAVDHLLVLEDGQMEVFGPREKVIEHMAHKRAGRTKHLRQVPEAGVERC